jgi:BRO family, N-terminal domain
LTKFSGFATIILNLKSKSLMQLESTPIVKPDRSVVCRFLGVELEWVEVNNQLWVCAGDALEMLGKNRTDAARVSQSLGSEWRISVCRRTRPGHHLSKEGLVELIFRIDSPQAHELRQKLIKSMALSLEPANPELVADRPRAPYKLFDVYRNGGGKLSYQRWGDEVWWPEEKAKLEASKTSRKDGAWNRYKIYQATGGSLNFVDWRDRVWNSGGSGLRC